MQTLSRQILSTLGNWLKGELQITGIMVILYTVAFALTHVPAWYVLGPLCGLLYLVPIFGGPAGLILTLAIMYFGKSSLGAILATLGLWILIQSIEGFYLTPTILGRHTKIAPLAVFVGGIAASAVLGPLGLIFAVPVMAVILVIFRYYDHPR